MEANETEEYIELWLRVFHGAVGSLLLLCSIFGSCAVLLLVLCNKKLRYPSTLASLGLVVADLVLAIAWLFQVLALSSVGDWTFEDDTCTAFGVLLVWMLYVRWSEVAVVTADRFLIVIFPFFTYQRCSKPLLITMSILAWVVPAAFVLPSIHGFGVYNFRLQISSCTVDCEGDAPCTAFYTALFGVYLLIGGVLPAVMYTAMYCTGLRKRWKYKNRKLGTVATSESVSGPTENTQSSSSSGNDVVEAAVSDNINLESSPADAGGNVIKKQSGQAQSTPNKRHRSTMFRIKPRERRALVTIFIIFISMIITHIPTYALSSIRSIGDIYESTPLIVHYISVYIFFLGPILDSVIIVRSKDFRDVITKMFKRRQVRPTIRYSTQRRPSIVLLLSGRRNSLTPQTNRFYKKDCSNSIPLENRETWQTRLDVINEDNELPSHTLNVERQVSNEASYQYVTEV